MTETMVAVCVLGLCLLAMAAASAVQAARFARAAAERDRIAADLANRMADKVAANSDWQIERIRVEADAAKAGAETDRAWASLNGTAHDMDVVRVPSRDLGGD